MSKATDKLKDWFQTVWRILRSKAVLTAIAGLLIHLAVRKGYIPDSDTTQAVEAAVLILCGVFRVTATVDLKQPATTLSPEVKVAPQQEDLIQPGS